jgi:uncharacterized repeat protein (TIGR01451 family)
VGGSGPTLSIGDISAAEGNAGTTSFTFTVTLSEASGSEVSVQADTADGSATAPEDYAKVADLIVSFAPGETSKPVTVAVNGDTTLERDETFFVNLTVPSGATIADGQGTGMIVDDDDQPPSADLSVTIADDPDPMSQYGVATYTMNASNAGPNSATGTTLTATVPSGLTVISVAPSQGTCTIGPPVSCALGTVGSGSHATVTIRAVATATGTKTVSASVSSAEDDPDPADDADSEGTVVNALACTITGTGANNTITGTAGNDVICGVGGKDTIDGAGGHDILVGGPGADNLTGGTGNDSLLGGTEGDTLTSTDGVSGNDLLAGGPQTDSCTGDPAAGGVAGDAKSSCP